MAKLTSRVARAFEEYGVWHGSHEWARRSRNTRRQIFKLVKQLEDGQRNKTLKVVAQLEFQAAFTSTNPRAVYRTFEACGVPEQDIQLVRRMHQGSWYSVANSFGESAACAP